ncbi:MULTISPECIES: LLM class flavin-dependent oxidoreductase [Nocardia]|uniref:LLM class flavin-dependent oxidoreductase n=1 Tax=Nocardia TaxID=1817 RepID=UPI000BF0E173|nr:MULTISPECIES: LLM class flavin-dependent oxidoreductase [Nocardia]MBF6187032.1 LLM class flavin-dependent oxidoreductase [Nocardia farcinica]MBF6312679.1 LLM class flavin-dependent oxidoreductase [Nocardia farcinica]MBF6408466.1 LLM class flavin-dependent oxidoreductase [Nocardia farcinica]PEH78923.1 LLM class flavin-dependent oxidoreductase [Nocardia sp. FDAARGOS_372]UEX23550.1 LLM class flavin-dependent oxidoreductase [Nocardia farcinica]
MTIPLSVLDLAPIAAGSSARQALRNSVELAQLAERWGYRRYWVAEHHFAQVASSSTATLVALLTSATKNIRVGSAAIQLGHHTPVAIVEAFGTIDALFPGRLDLGLGRSAYRAAQQPARRTTAVAAEKTASRSVQGVVIPAPFVQTQPISPTNLDAWKEVLPFPDTDAADFGQQVRDVLSLIDGTFRTTSGVELHAVPGESAFVQPWLFGSSAHGSARLAGELGLPFAASYHVSPSNILETVEAYRDSFRPSSRFPRPYLAVSADVVVASDDATASHRAATYGHWVHSIRSGQGTGAAHYLDPDTTAPLDEDARQLVLDRVSTQMVGSAATVSDRLNALQRLTSADELVITSVTHSQQHRLESHRLLAETWGLRSLG